MKKRILTGFALMLLFQVHAQTQPADSTGYKSTKLKIDEINLVSSYYKQDGNNSAVTGGEGTEELTDLSNTLDVRLVKYGKSGKKHSLDVEVGVDHYSSASSDQIDHAANSSASSADNRFYPSLTYSLENEAKGTTFTAGVSSSTEFDYQSFGGNIGYSAKTKNRSGEFTARFQAFVDQIKMILPTELRTGGEENEHYGSESRNTFAGSLSYSQIVNKNFQVMFIADVITQSGYLGLPFHRVYFSDGPVRVEKLPDTRLKIPLAVRGSYFLGDSFIIRGYYRYYTDDWGIHAHTADIELPIKLTSFVSVSPFYRFYSQSAAKYFDVINAHSAADEFYTSNYDLSKFTSNFFGTGVKFTPVNGVFGWKHFNTLEIRYGHYDKSNSMAADIVSVNIKYK